MKDHIRQLIGEGRLEEALKLMAPYAPDDVLLQQGRLAGLNRQNNMGLLDFDEFSRKQNQITVAALELLKKVPGGSDPLPDPQPTPQAPPVLPPQPAHLPAIYFSYAWGDGEENGESREEIVNQLYESLKKEGFHLKRDKMDLGYRGLISEFMREIGKSDLIVVVISDKYLRSPYCMHELNEIYRNSREEQAEFAKRIFPIRAESLKMSDPLVLKTYLKHWAEEENKWSDLVRDPELKKLGEGPLKQYVRIQKINENFGDLFIFLQDMNAMSKNLLAENDFAIVKDAIRQRMQELTN